MRRLLVACAIVIACPTAEARGWTADRVEGQLRVVDDVARPDRLAVGLGADGRVEVENDGVLNGAVPADCSYDAETAVLSCARASISGLIALTGPGDDSVEVLFDLPSRLEGGDGSDALSSAGAGDVLLGGPGADLLDSGAGADAVNGGDDADRLDGGEGADDVAGDAGDDVLDGLEGADRLAGGEGADVLDGGADSDTLAGDAGGDRLDGAEGDDRADGGAGSDVIDGAGGDDVAHGGDDADVLDGGTGADDLAGGTGDDRLDGDTGVDRLRGDDGADALEAVGTDTENLDGGAGPDLLDAEGVSAPAALSGGPGDDRLLGGAAADRLDGGTGDDRLASSPAGDVLLGGEGTDTMSYEEADGGVSVTVGRRADDGVSGEGDDVAADVETVVGGTGDDELVAAAGGTTLRGGEGVDRVIGGAGRDALHGDEGDDRLDGRGGPDVLTGGPDRDLLFYADRTRPLVLELGRPDRPSGERGEGDSLADPFERVVAGRGDDRVVGATGISHRLVLARGDDVADLDDAADAAPDAVRCGIGRDLVRTDRFDTYDRACERVLVDGKDRRPRTGVVASSQLSFALSSGRGAIRVACGARTRSFCDGRATVSRTGRSRAVALGRFRIAAGRSKRVTLRLTGAGRRALARARPGRLRLRLTARDGLGRGATRVVRVRVRFGGDG